MKKTFIYIIVAVCLIALGIFGYRMISAKEQSVTFQTEPVKRATISNTVTATGTLEASVTVEVGTQVSGKVIKLYVDNNSIVKKGQLIAKIDEEALQSTLDQSKATLDQAQAEYEYQKANYERYGKLIAKKLIAQSDFDEMAYNYKTAEANLNSAKATYKKNKTNLDYAYIYSPIDGIVLDRAVEEGETVAASFETPTLFTIANDLTQMEIEADVDEADIGHVRVGQRVEFTVDAFPDKVFEGKVTEIRLMPPDEDESVITYTVIIDAPNPEKILYPGMTANAEFYVTEKQNILVVPNLAVEFSPDMASLQAYQEKHPEVKIKTQQAAESAKTVWVKTPTSIYPVNITVGETDEINYEILSGDLKEGTDLITSMTSAYSNTTEASDEAAQSPFMPTPPGKKKK